MGGEDEADLEAKYEHVVDRLDFRLSEPRAEAGGPGA